MKIKDNVEPRKGNNTTAKHPVVKKQLARSSPRLTWVINVILTLTHTIACVDNGIVK